MTRVLQTLDLFSSEPIEAPSAVFLPVQSRPQLWLAIHLPNLSLECFPGVVWSQPSVAVATERGKPYVVACSDSATEAGVNPGMQLSTAMAIVAQLKVFERKMRLEQESLESLAEWTQTLTSVVSVEPPASLLLEVSGSLKLFGSLDVIKTKLRVELARRYRYFRLCVAPTATAALWLVRGGGGDVLSWHEIVGRVGALPLRVTQWPPAVQALLWDLGVRNVADCVRLPRDGFARRVGPGYLHELDKAFGRHFDLRAEFKAPNTWSARNELFEESVDSALLLAAIEPLIEDLAVELRERQAAIGSLQIAYEHLHHPPTVERFELLEPTHERDRLLYLINDRLERSTLPVPAIALCVSSGVFTPIKLREVGLFEQQPLDELVQVLLEHLQSRFGATAVYGLRTVAEHRPEKAWTKFCGLGSRLPSSPRAPSRNVRPLWLLSEPLPLSSLDTHDRLRSALELCSGPERIESGWWDGRDVGRDYYTAKNSHGQKLWVFRDHRNSCWYLHGLFG